MSTCPRDTTGSSLSHSVLLRGAPPFGRTRKGWLWVRFRVRYVLYVNSDDGLSPLSVQTTRRYGHHFFFIGPKSILNFSCSLTDLQLKARKKNGAVFRRLVFVSGLNWPNHFA
jgi:hypothetical protein